jgi:hypothetical protein
VASGRIRLPPAWLIASDQAFPATFGSFTWTTRMSDGSTEGVSAQAIEPEYMRWLATAALSGDEQPVLIVNSSAVKTVEPQIRPWTQEPDYRPFTPLEQQAGVERNGEFSVVTLSPLNDVSDQLLYVYVTFENGDVSYFWRLNPAD